MKKQIILLTLVCFVFLLCFSLAFAQEKSESGLTNSKEKYPGSSIEYKGILVEDWDGDGDDELVCDFGSLGVWLYNNWSWTKVNSHDPDWMISFDWGANTYILADFGSLGLWQGYGSTSISWVKENNNNASFGFAVDDDNDGNDEVYIDFGSLGLWRKDWTTGVWTKINNSSPTHGLQGDFWSVGHEEGNFNFSGKGLWNVYWWTGSPLWTKLSNHAADNDFVSAELGIGDAAEELVCDFMGLGTWLYDGSNWHQISTNDPWDIKAVRNEGSSDYELLALWNYVSGLWWWDYTGYPGTWTKINNNNPSGDEAFCEPYDPNGNTEGNNDQEVAVDFGTLGIWQWDYTFKSWTKINNNSPQRMIKADLYNDGYKTTLICDFGSLGLWFYDGRYGFWHKINSHDVEQN